jgi:ribonuclease BN (tRNA processing enzyme)
VVYLTDVELQAAEPGVLEGIREFCTGADLVIADTQFGRGEITRKADWGHSSVFQFIELLSGTAVKRLALFHYDPKYTDEVIDEIYYEATAFAREQAPDWACELIASHEGLELSLPAPEPAGRTSDNSGGADQ